MKEIRILTVNEGNKETITRAPWFVVTEAEKTEEYIGEFLNDGWNIAFCFPDFNPAIQENGNYTFYKNGYTFVLEREA